MDTKRDDKKRRIEGLVWWTIGDFFGCAATGFIAFYLLGELSIEVWGLSEKAERIIIFIGWSLLAGSLLFIFVRLKRRANSAFPDGEFMAHLSPTRKFVGQTLLDLVLFAILAIVVSICLTILVFGAFGLTEKSPRIANLANYLVLGLFVTIFVVRGVKRAMRIFGIFTSSLDTDPSLSKSWKRAKHNEPEPLSLTDRVADFAWFTVVDLVLATIVGYFALLSVAMLSIRELSDSPSPYADPIAGAIVVCLVVAVLTRCVLRARRLFCVPSATPGKE